MSTTIREVDMDDLRPEFQDGLAELMRTHRHQDIEPVIEVQNMVVVCLGSFDVTQPRFDEDRAGRDLEYDHSEYTVYARIAHPFPDWGGSNAKGFATSPPLERVGHPLQNNPWGTEVLEPLQEYLDEPVQMYSWSWEGVPISHPRDMKFAFDLAVTMLRYG